MGSEATISRTITTLAQDADKALKAIHSARAAAREAAWDLAGERSPGHGACAQDPVVVDLDATLITAHSEKEQAAPTFKRGYGHHPLCAFLDHGPEGTGEPLALRLRPGNAGSNTATDHIAVTKDALAQLPGVDPSRPGKKVLIRADGAGGTKEFTQWLTRAAAWPTAWGSRCRSTPLTCWAVSPRTCGPRPTTTTGRPGPVRTWPS